MNRVKAAFFNNGELPFIKGDPIDHVFARGRRERIASLTDLHPVTVSSHNFETEAARLDDLQAIFATWGMPQLTDQHLDRLPELQAVFYAAGSVKHWAPPFLERGITVVSAASANAIPVAEFCLAQILLAAKGYFRNVSDCRTLQCNSQTTAFHGRGTYGETVAIIGAGKVGRHLIRMLKPFQLQVLVVDPYLPKPDAQAMGVQVVSLEKAFADAYVVSNHLPDLLHLRGLLNGKLFASMRPDATFVNTGRGAQVNESEMIAVLKQRQDLTALLDVTDPEPCRPDSPLLALKNVHVTSHMAGAHDDEVVRMADLVIDEFQRWQTGQSVRHHVSVDLLARTA